MTVGMVLMFAAGMITGIGIVRCWDMTHEEEEEKMFVPKTLPGAKTIVFFSDQFPEQSGTFTDIPENVIVGIQQLAKIVWFEGEWLHWKTPFGEHCKLNINQLN